MPPSRPCTDPRTIHPNTSQEHTMGFQQGLSGLNAASKNLDVIGHNIRSEEHTSELQSQSNLVCRIIRSEEHTSELQSQSNLVCRLLLEKKNTSELHSQSNLG